MFAVTLAKNAFRSKAGHSFQMQHAKQFFSYYKTAASSVQQWSLLISFWFFPPPTVGIERLATPGKSVEQMCLWNLSDWRQLLTIHDILWSQLSKVGGSCYKPRRVPKLLQKPIFCESVNDESKNQFFWHIRRMSHLGSDGIRRFSNLVLASLNTLIGFFFFSLGCRSQFYFVIVQEVNQSQVK